MLGQLGMGVGDCTAVYLGLPTGDGQGQGAGTALLRGQR